MTLWYTPEATAHLDNIHAYIQSDNPEAAAAVVTRIHATARALAFFPHMGRVGHLSGTLEHKVKQLPYVIVYRIEIGDTDQLVILGVYHTHQKRN